MKCYYLFKDETKTKKMEVMMKPDNQYSTHYSDSGFWAKLKRNAAKAGKDVVIMALILYYALQDDDTPAWAKAVILAVLGYLIMPLDLIPDFKPVIGYADDATVILKAFIAVAVHLKDDHISQAHDVWNRWAGVTAVAA